MRIMRNLWILGLIGVMLFGCAENEVDKGERLFNGGQYAAAVQSYSDYLKNHPDDAEVLYKRGAAYERLNKMEKAIEDYSKAADADNQEPKYWTAIAMVQYRLAQAAGNRESEPAQEKYNAGLTAANEAIKINPNLAKSYVVRGNIQTQLKKTKSAREDFSKAINIESDNAEAYFGRGYVFTVVNKFDEACSDFKKAKQYGHPQADKALSQFQCN